MKKTLVAIALSAAAAAAAVFSLPSSGALAANSGNPAVFAATASVDILEPILITESLGLSFGRILPPTTGTQVFTVATDGTIVAGPGSGQAIGGHQSGKYDITGTNSELYQLSISFGGCSDIRLGLTGITTNAPVPTVLDQTNVRIGGQLSVAAGVPEGVHTCQYSLTAQYP